MVRLILSITKPACSLDMRLMHLCLQLALTPSPSLLPAVARTTPLTMMDVDGLKVQAKSVC